jgi:hypothetical protein
MGVLVVESATVPDIEKPLFVCPSEIIPIVPNEIRKQIFLKILFRLLIMKFLLRK